LITPLTVSSNQTLFEPSVHVGDERNLRRLLAARAKIEPVRTTDGITPLIYSLQKGDTLRKMAVLLLVYGADPAKTKVNQLPLFFCVLLDLLSPLFHFSHSLSLFLTSPSLAILALFFHSLLLGLFVFSLFSEGWSDFSLQSFKRRRESEMEGIERRSARSSFRVGTKSSPWDNSSSSKVFCSIVSFSFSSRGTFS
jgi:hypothetical protein